MAKVSKYGQWKYPGEDTIIPSGNITMQGVPYPVFGIDNLGNAKMMQPGGNYTFPGTAVYEIPMMAYGGDISVPSLKRVKIKSLPKAQTVGELKEQALQRDWNRQQAKAWDPNERGDYGEEPLEYNPQTGQYTNWKGEVVRVDVKPKNIGLPPKQKVSKEDKAYAEAQRENKKILNTQSAEDAWYTEHPEFIKDPVTGAPIRREAYELGSAEGFKEARIEEEKKKFVDDLNSDPLQQSLGTASLDNPVTNAAAERYADYKVNNVDPGRASDQLFRGYQAPTTKDFYQPNEFSNTLRGAAGLGATAAGIYGLTYGLAYLPVLGEAAYAWGSANPFLQATGAALSASPSWAPGLSIGNAINAGFITHGISELPETYRAWDNAINNNGSYLDAAGQTLFNAVDFLGIGELKGSGILDDIITKSVQEAGTLNINPTEVFIRNLQRENLIPAGTNVKTLLDNPNLLNNVVTRGIKNNLTVGRRVTPSAGAGVAESSSGTITDLATGDAAALARFTGDPVGEAFYMGTHIPREAYGMRSGLQGLPYDLDALYFDAPGKFARQVRATPNTYGDFTITSRIPFEYSSDPQRMYAEYMRMLQETKGMSGGKGAKPGDIFGELHGIGANESAIVGKPGQQVLEPVSVSTIADYNKPLAEFDELFKLSKEDPEKFKTVFWEKANSGQLARTRQELGLSEDAMFLDPLYGIGDNPTLNELRFALRADANNKQLALNANAPIQKTNFSPLTTSFGNSAPVELTASQANRRLVTAQKQFDALSKRGYENLSPDELLDAFRLEHEINTLNKQLNKTIVGETLSAADETANWGLTKGKDFVKSEHKDLADTIDQLREDRIKFWETSKGKARLEAVIENTPELKAGGLTVDDYIANMRSMTNENRTAVNQLAKADEILAAQEKLIDDFENIKFLEQQTGMQSPNGMTEQYVQDELTKLQKQLDDLKIDFENLSINSIYVDNAFMNRHGAISLGKSQDPRKLPNPYTKFTTGIGQYFTVSDARRVIQHELGHLIQRGVKTNLDKELEGLKLLKNESGNLFSSAKGSSSDTQAYDAIFNKTNDYFKKARKYFNTGGKGQEKLPFLEEVRADMLERGMIKNLGDDITEDMIKQHYANYMMEVQGEKYPLRLYDIMENNPANFSLLKSVMNKMPLVIIATGVGYSVMGGDGKEQPALPQKKRGGAVSAISKYKNNFASKVNNNLPVAQVGFPNDYQDFLNYSETAPENRRPDSEWQYGNPRQYDHYGMWDALGKPKNFDEALQKNPHWQPDPYDGMYHGFSTNPDTGVWLKSHIPGESHPGDTGWMEYKDFMLSNDPEWGGKNQNLVFDPELQRMRYIERKKGGVQKAKTKKDKGFQILTDANGKYVFVKT
jgi:hypothetical protein